MIFFDTIKFVSIYHLLLKSTLIHNLFINILIKRMNVQQYVLYMYINYT